PAVAVGASGRGGAPRLPLELALVKVTRPGADLSRESFAYRLEQLEQTRHVAVAPTQAIEAPTTPPSSPPPPRAEPPSLELEQLQEAWRRTIVRAVGGRPIPAAPV